MIKLKSEMTKLKPCPFCGRQPEVIVNKAGNMAEYWIVCKCGIESRIYVSKQGAVKAWNRRKGEVKNE